MRKIIFQITAYLKYYFKAETLYTIHSPYIYELLAFVSDQHRTYYDFLLFRKLKQFLRSNKTALADNRDISSQESGARTWRIGQLMKNNLWKSGNFEVLYRFILFFSPRQMLCLGTSMGMTPAYIARAVPGCKVLAIEHQNWMVHLAQQVLSRAMTPHVQLSGGSWLQLCNQDLKIQSSFDGATIDISSNQMEAIQSVEVLCTAYNPSFIFLYGIHSSSLSWNAWKKIKSQPSFNISIELFNVGLLIRKEAIDENIDLAFISYAKKFWKAGFFS